jgi:MarR family transcriptional regulator for hemolysin
METCKQSIGFEIGKMMRAVFREFKKYVTEHSDKKLTVEQFGLLYSIKQEPTEVIQNEMAEMLGKDKSSILRMIDSLEAKGM